MPFRENVNVMCGVCRYIFSRVILYTFFSFLLLYGGLGVGVLGLESWIGLLGLGFSVDS